MLKIFICEDNPEQRESVERIVKNYLMMMDIDASLELSTNDPNDLLEWSTLEHHDYLFFLDIELNHEINGVVLASRLRECYPQAKIAFITSHTEMAFLSFFYKVEALDFIQKKNEDELKISIVDVINTTINRIKRVPPDNTESIFIRNNHTDIKLAIKDIMFFVTTTTAHKLSVHLLNRQLEFYSNIKDIPNYHDSFYRCHQSTVVNLANIESINSKTRTIKMIDGNTCDVSVRYLKGLINKFKEEKKRMLDTFEVK